MAFLPVDRGEHSLKVEGEDGKDADSENDLTISKPSGFGRKVTTERYVLRTINVTGMDGDQAEVSLTLNNNCEPRSDKIPPLNVFRHKSDKCSILSEQPSSDSDGCKKNEASDRPVEIPNESENIKGRGYIRSLKDFFSLIF